MRFRVWCPGQQKYESAMDVDCDTADAAVVEWAAAHTIEHSGNEYIVFVEFMGVPHCSARFKVQGGLCWCAEARYVVRETKALPHHPSWVPWLTPVKGLRGEEDWA